MDDGAGLETSHHIAPMSFSRDHLVLGCLLERRHELEKGRPERGRHHDIDLRRLYHVRIDHAQRKTTVSQRIFSSQAIATPSDNPGETSDKTFECLFSPLELFDGASAMRQNVDFIAS